MMVLTLKLLKFSPFLVCALIKSSLFQHRFYAHNRILPVTMLCSAFPHGLCKMCLFALVFCFLCCEFMRYLRHQLCGELWTQASTPCCSGKLSQKHRHVLPYSARIQTSYFLRAYFQADMTWCRRHHACQGPQQLFLLACFSHLCCCGTQTPGQSRIPECSFLSSASLLTFQTLIL